MSELESSDQRPPDQSIMAVQQASNGYVTGEQLISGSMGPNDKRDTGTLIPDWSQELLSRYNLEICKLDGEEERLLHRLEAIQRLQILWSTAGRQSEMGRSENRIKVRITKVLLEDDNLSKKRRKLNGVMAAIQDLVGMLDGNEIAVHGNLST